jgi:HK97 family phage prohead protease
MSREIEKRIVASKLSLRAAPDGVASPGILEGYAATFNSWSQDLGGFKETIQRGAFDRALRENQDVRCLVNHDPSLVLGRWNAGTLGLTTDAQGLRFTCQLPDTSAGRDIHTLVKRGDISQCSFAFRVADNGDQWNKQRTERTLTDVDLMDVSAVTYPAYEATSVSARSRRFDLPNKAAVLSLSAAEQLEVLLRVGRLTRRIEAAESTPEAIRQRVKELGESIAADDKAARERE